MWIPRPGRSQMCIELVISIFSTFQLSPQNNFVTQINFPGGICCGAELTQHNIILNTYCIGHTYRPAICSIKSEAWSSRSAECNLCNFLSLSERVLQWEKPMCSLSNTHTEVHRTFIMKEQKHKTKTHNIEIDKTFTHTCRGLTLINSTQSISRVISWVQDCQERYNISLELDPKHKQPTLSLKGNLHLCNCNYGWPRSCIEGLVLVYSSLTLKSELMNPEMGNSAVLVPEKLIWVSSNACDGLFPLKTRAGE